MFVGLSTPNDKTGDGGLPHIHFTPKCMEPFYSRHHDISYSFHVRNLPLDGEDKHPPNTGSGKRGDGKSPEFTGQCVRCIHYAIKKGLIVGWLKGRWRLYWSFWVLFWKTENVEQWPPGLFWNGTTTYEICDEKKSENLLLLVWPIK